MIIDPDLAPELVLTNGDEWQFWRALPNASTIRFAEISVSPFMGWSARW
jgi:hypothetical protein